MKDRWERIDNYTDRLQVYQGWLVRSTCISYAPDQYGNQQEVIREAMVFVSDASYTWVLPKEGDDQ